MLVLTRNKDTAVRIGSDILVTVREFHPGEVTVDVDYPSHLTLKSPGGAVAGEPIAPEGGAETPPSGTTKLRASLALKLEDEIRIGDEILVKVVALQNPTGVPYRVRLGFQAPVYMLISRTDHKDGQMPPPGEGPT